MIGVLAPGIAVRYEGAGLVVLEVAVLLILPDDTGGLYIMDEEGPDCVVEYSSEEARLDCPSEDVYDMEVPTPVFARVLLDAMEELESDRESEPARGDVTGDMRRSDAE